MSNDITKHYYAYLKTQREVDAILGSVTKESGFMVSQRIFQGRIYDLDKLGSSIYSGTWRGNSAVLKVQLLPLDVDEVAINKGFIAQNSSANIRLATIYDHHSWSSDRGYGYIIQEYIPPQPLFSQRPLATDGQRIDFCKFYSEYKEHCLHQPLWKSQEHEQSSLQYTKLRVQRWIEISKSKGDLTPHVEALIPRYFSIIEEQLDSIPMEWMHGHLAGWDILKPDDDIYVLMSNLYWGYRPAYYDATFHLWASIKEVRDTSVSLNHILIYIEDWKKAYRAIPYIKQDPIFEKAFDLMFFERTLTALLLDIHNQDYHTDREESIAHLMDIFFSLFEVFSKKVGS